MSEDVLSFTIQGDSEGYVTFECPFCDSEFKLQAGEFQNDEVDVMELFCPYCGLTTEKSKFFTDEVMEKAKAIATNFYIEKLNKSFGKMEKSINSGRKGPVSITMQFKPLKKVNVKELKEKETNEEIFECSVCNNHVKVLYCAGASKVFCPYCGVDY